MLVWRVRRRWRGPSILQHSCGVHIYMPLFATGVDQLTNHEACLVQTSVIGDLADEMRRRKMVAPKIVVRLLRRAPVSALVMGLDLVVVDHDVPVGPRPDR